MTTEEDLKNALTAWEVAREKAAYQHAAWGALLQSHKSLITSMRAVGYSWSQAKAEFEALSEGRRDALVASWVDMDEKCREYKEIAERLGT